MKPFTFASVFAALALATASSWGQVIVTSSYVTPVATYYRGSYVVPAATVYRPAVTTYYAPAVVSSPVIESLPVTTVQRVTYAAPVTTYYAPTTVYSSPAVVAPVFVARPIRGDLYGRPTIYAPGRPVVNSFRYVLP